MIWAIHPTVFELAREKPKYAVALEYIADQVEKAEDHLAFDGNGLFEKYIELAEKFIIDPSPNVQAVVRLFTPILKGHEDSLAPLPAPVIDDFGDIYVTLSSSLECKLIESQLLLMALNAKRSGGLVVLLPETDYWKNVGINPIRFYRPEASRVIARCLRGKGFNENDWWFHVKDISDIVQINNNVGSANSPAHVHSQKFEILVRDKFLDENSCFVRSEVPSDITKGAGQVDVYIVSNSPLEILVAECKLRDKGNESKLIDGEEMRKLCLVVTETIEYVKRTSLQPLKISGYLVSNAQGVHPNAWEVYRTLSANWFDQNVQIEVAFRRAILPNNWYRQDAFNIVRLESPVFDK